MLMLKHSGSRVLPFVGITLLVACAADDGARAPGVELGDASPVQVPPGTDASSTPGPAAIDSGLVPPVGLGPADAGVSRLDGSNVCASVRVAATRITPQVILAIDGSGSMAEPLGNISRWGALRDAL